MNNIKKRRRAEGVVWGEKIVKLKHEKAKDKAKVNAENELYDIAETCYEYSTNRKLRKTKKGTPLTDDIREFYESAFITISKNMYK